jgi:hypothetical protein
MAGLGISEAMELARKATELVKGLATIGLQETIMDLRQAILNVKDEMLRLREENQALRTQVAEKSSWDESAAGYKLIATPTGGTVYHTEGPPDHYACPTCFASRKIIPLQHAGGSSVAYQCPQCKAMFPIQERQARSKLEPPTGRGGANSWMRR